MEKYSATIGFFDGVHVGHQFLLDQLKSISEKANTKTMVVSFINHPRIFFEPDCGLKFLSNAQEKTNLIENFGIDRIHLYKFDKEMARKTSREFMQELHDQYGVVQLLVGYDHHFGSDTKTTFEEYQKIGKEIGVEVIQGKGMEKNGIQVSSTKIRHALEEGRITDATTLLGHPYIIRGKIIHGKAIGRKLGFPTANMQTGSFKLIPKKGVYAVKVRLDNKETYKGVMNIGNRPTLDNGGRSLEVHLLDFNQDLYCNTIQVDIIKYVREEQKFDSLEDLIAQIKIDVETVKQLDL